MSSQKCAKCGKDNPENIQRFIALEVNTNTKTNYSKSYKTKTTTTTQTESFKGAYRCAVCDDCVRASRKKYALTDTLTMLVPFILLLAIFKPIAGDYANDPLFRYVYFGCVAVFAIVCCTAMFLGNIRLKTPWVIKRMMRKFPDLPSKWFTYIPIQSSLYCKKNSNTPDIEVFQKIAGLKTEIGSNIFWQYIVTFQGEQLVDTMLEQQSDI